MRTDRWIDVARAAGLLSPSGAVAPTTFAEMSELATRTGAANLGQGFPDVDGPEHLREAAVAAIRDGHNQYPPGPGIPQLREARRSFRELLTANAEGISAPVLSRRLTDLTSAGFLTKTQAPRGKQGGTRSPSSGSARSR